MLYDAFILSLESNGFGATTNAMVVDKYCQKYDLDFINTLSICKQLLGAYNEK